MLLLILSLGACSEEKEGELCFVGDSLVAGWDVKDAFPTWIVRNDGVSGAKLEEIATWSIRERSKDWLHVGCSLFLFYLEIERSITRI